jgi:ribosomal protein S18 acetylase RimI-like enzyme
MRKAATLTHDVVELPPFVLFFNPHDALRYHNYAKLLTPIGRDAGPDVAEALAQARAAFVARQRLPRFEFIAEFAPDFAALLAAANFAPEESTVLLTCTPATWRPAPPVPGLEIVTLAPDSPAEDLLARIAVQRQGFGDDTGQPPTLADAEHLRARLAQTGAFLARLEGAPVAAAGFTAPLDGFTELVGIATLEEQRRRGIATALTAHTVRVAFDRGVEVAFLTAADARAGRVYERVGFRPFATALAYYDRSFPLE